MSRSSKTVLLVAHDRGGVNLLAPLLRYWRRQNSGIAPTFLGTPMIQQEMEAITEFDKGEPSSKAEGSKIRPVRVSGRGDAYLGRSVWTFAENDLRRVLTETPWDLVLTGTSAISTMEKAVWGACRELGLPCTALCDMWTEYEQRLTNAEGELLIDNLLVIDQRMADEVQKAFGSPPKTTVVGSPHFSALLESRESRMSDRQYIRFISEPIAALFPKARVHEFHVAEIVIDSLRAVGEASRLLLRPHPQDDSEGWRRFAYKYRDRDVALDLEPSWMCPVTTRAAIGLSSMMLIELALAGVPVASFQPTDADSSYFCLPEQEFGISVVSNGSELKDWMANISPPSVDPSFVAWHKPAIERITEMLVQGSLVT